MKKYRHEIVKAKTIGQRKGKRATDFIDAGPHLPRIGYVFLKAVGVERKVKD